MAGLNLTIQVNDTGTQKVNAFRRTVAGARGPMDSFKGGTAGMSQGLTGLGGSADKVSIKIKSLASSWAGAAAAAAGFAGVGLAAKNVLDTNLAYERINRSLETVTGSSSAAAKEFAFITSESDRLGMSVRDSALAYAKLAAGAKGTALEGKAARDIFSAVSEAAARMSLSTDDANGALKAIEQMISKGNVQAEELRGQLGERLPGAFQMAARAMGVTTAELNDMLKDGSVLATDLLPKLAVEIRRTFGTDATTRIDTARAAINRLDNAMDQLKLKFTSSGGLSAFSSSLEAVTENLDEIVMGLEAVALAGGSIMAGRGLAAAGRWGQGVIQQFGSAKEEILLFQAYGIQQSQAAVKTMELAQAKVWAAKATLEMTQASAAELSMLVGSNKVKSSLTILTKDLATAEAELAIATRAVGVAQKTAAATIAVTNTAMQKMTLGAAAAAAGGRLLSGAWAFIGGWPGAIMLAATALVMFGDKLANYVLPKWLTLKNSVDDFIDKIHSMNTSPLAEAEKKLGAINTELAKLYSQKSRMAMENDGFLPFGLDKAIDWARTRNADKGIKDLESQRNRLKSEIDKMKTQGSLPGVGNGGAGAGGAGDSSKAELSRLEASISRIKTQLGIEKELNDLKVRAGALTDEQAAKEEMLFQKYIMTAELHKAMYEAKNGEKTEDKIKADSEVKNLEREIAAVQKKYEWNQKILKQQIELSDFASQYGMLESKLNQRGKSDQIKVDMNQMSPVEALSREIEGEREKMKVKLEWLAKEKAYTGDKLKQLEIQREMNILDSEMKDTEGERLRIQQAINNQVRGILDSVATEKELAQREIDNLKRTMDSGLLNSSQIDDYTRAITILQNRMHGFDRIADGMADSFGRAFESMTFDSMTFKDAMANLAKDIAKVIYEVMVMDQIKEAVRSGASSFNWGSIGASIMGMFGGGASAGASSLPSGVSGSMVAARGRVFGEGGSLMAFASGGIVNGPTAFNYRGGRGLMGEAGPEAIMPLRRGPDGSLGVSGGSSQPVLVQIIDQRKNGGIEEQETTGANGEKIMRVIIRDEVTRALSPGGYAGRQLQTTYGATPRTASR